MSNTPFRACSRRILSVSLVLMLLMPALSAEAKKKSATTYAKVKVSVAKMYKTTKNKKVFIRLKKGSVVVVKGVHGKWAKIKARGHVGYMLVKKLVKVKSKAASNDAAAFSYPKLVI